MTDKIRKFFDSCPDTAEIDLIRGGEETKRGEGPCLLINWSLKDNGFGELAIFKEDGEWKIDSECMNRDTVKKILGILVDSLPLTDE